jgi:hypothetical protein
LTDPDYDIPEYSYSRRRREAAFDPLMRRIALGAGGIATLVILVALVWGGMKPGAGFGPPPVIQAPPGPLRVAPADPGGLTVPGADQQIMSGQSTATPDALEPAAPAPDMSAFQPPPPPPPAPAPPANAPSAAAPAPVVPAPVSASSAEPSALPPVPPVTDSKIEVQLAATPDPADARTEWTKLSGKMPGLFSGRSPIYSHAVVAGVEFWRLRVNGFADIGAARQFCDQVKAQGGACTVAAF